MRSFTMDKDIQNRINILYQLGNFLKTFLEELGEEPAGFSNEGFQELDNAMQNAEIENPWFTRQFQLYNLRSWSKALESESLHNWIRKYPELLDGTGSPRKIGLVLAGNIPLVGLHDIICVLVSGNIAVTRLSSKDRHVYPVIKKIMSGFEGFSEDRWILLDDAPLKEIDAVIATGSDNSSRYFDYYFGKYPNIIRKNRNSAAILTGEETSEDMRKLADDIFLYFGLGCRNVSKIFVPEHFSPEKLYEGVEHYAHLINHNKYANNYDYQRAILLVNKVQFYDNGFLILKEDTSFSSPVGSLFFETYSDINRVLNKIQSEREKIQCIVGNIELFPDMISFGNSQLPGLNEYADNIDTLKFLINLSKN